jgi:hypothetical protein
MTPVATLLQMRASARITLRCVLVEVADDPADDVVVRYGIEDLGWRLTEQRCVRDRHHRDLMGLKHLAASALTGPGEPVRHGLEAGQVVPPGEVVHVGQGRMHPARERLVGRVLLERI